MNHECAMSSVQNCRITRSAPPVSAKLPPMGPNDSSIQMFFGRLTVARLMSLTIFSPGLLRVLVVCLMSHSSVATMSQQLSLIKYRYLEP